MIISSSFSYFIFFFHWRCFNVSLFRQSFVVVLRCSAVFRCSGGVPSFRGCSVIPCSGVPSFIVCRYEWKVKWGWWGEILIVLIIDTTISKQKSWFFHGTHCRIFVINCEKRQIKSVWFDFILWSKSSKKLFQIKW